jgi:hypothetical protein
LNTPTLQIDDDKGCQVWLVEEESFVDLAQGEDDGVYENKVEVIF